VLFRQGLLGRHLGVVGGQGDGGYTGGHGFLRHGLSILFLSGVTCCGEMGAGLRRGGRRRAGSAVARIWADLNPFGEESNHLAAPSRRRGFPEWCHAFCCGIEGVCAPRQVCPLDQTRRRIGA